MTTQPARSHNYTPAQVEAITNMVNRAITYIELGDDVTVDCTLYYTDIHDHLKENPRELVRLMRDNLAFGHYYGIFRASHQILEAAGLLPEFKLEA